MKKLLKILAISLLVVSFSWAQGGVSNSVTLTSPPPTAVQNTFVSNTGATGLTTYCYWVVAVYNSGMAMPVQNVCTYSANSTLSVSNYNTITWNAPPGATTPIGYWVIRNTTPSFPGSGTTAVNSSIISASTFSQTDQSNTLNSFTFSPVGTASYTLAIDNADYGVPTVGLYTSAGALQWQRYMNGNIHHDVVSVEGNITVANIHAGTTIVAPVLGATLRVVGVLFQAVGGSAATCTSVNLVDTAGTVAVSIPVADLTSGTVNVETASNLTLTTFLTNLTAGAGLKLTDTGGACTTMTSMNYRFYFKIFP